MDYDDHQRYARLDDWDSSEDTRPPPVRPVSPGKRSLTASLPPRQRGGVGPVQTRRDPGAVTQRQARTHSTEQWMDAAIRPDLHAGPAGPGDSMPATVQAKMEHAFGTDLSQVRIHEGSQASSMGALAYTQGTDIHFAPGQYNPASQAGQELLGHELTHVAQQRAGRVQATTQAKGLAVNDSPALEREADELGSRAARGERVSMPTASGSAPGSSGLAPAQTKRMPSWAPGFTAAPMSGPVAQLAIKDDLKQSLQETYESYDKDAVKDALQTLFDTGYALQNNSGRVVYIKDGGWAQAKQEAESYLGLDTSQNRIKGGVNEYGQPKELYSGQFEGETVTLRNFGSQAGIAGTIEIHAAGFIFEFKQRPTSEPEADAGADAGATSDV